MSRYSRARLANPLLAKRADLCSTVPPIPPNKSKTAGYGPPSETKIEKLGWNVLKYNTKNICFVKKESQHSRGVFMEGSIWYINVHSKTGHMHVLCWLCASSPWYFITGQGKRTWRFIMFMWVEDHGIFFHLTMVTVPAMKKHEGKLNINVDHG